MAPEKGNCPCCDAAADEYVLECDKCKKWIHFACSKLPAYMLVQFDRSSRFYSCLTCVHERFMNEFPKLHDTFEEVISKQNKTLRSMTADTSSQTDPPPSDAESEPTQVDTPPLPQPTHPPPTTDQQKDTAQVTDHQSNDQQDNVDALPPKPTPTPPNSVILGLNVVNSNESRESSSANTVGSQTEIDANPDGSIDGDRDVTCRFYLQGRCKHGKMGKDCAFKHPPMCFKFVRRGPSACSKGATCNYIHPKLCNNALQTGKCYRITCKFYHIAGTLSEDPSTISKRPNLMDISVFPPQPSSSNANVPPRQLPHHLPRPNQLATHQQNHPTYPLPSEHPPQLRHPVPSQPQPVHTGYSHAGNSQSQNPSRYAPLQASQSQQRNVNPKPTIQNPSSTPNQLIQQGNHSPDNDSAFTPIHPPTNSPVFLEELRVVKQLMSQMQQMQSQLIQSMNYHYPLLPGPNPAL